MYLLPYIVGELLRCSGRRAASLWAEGSWIEVAKVAEGGGGGKLEPGNLASAAKMSLARYLRVYLAPALYATGVGARIRAVGKNKTIPSPCQLPSRTPCRIPN